MLESTIVAEVNHNTAFLSGLTGGATATRTRMWRAAALGTVLVALAACGGGKAATPSTTTTVPPTLAPTTTVPPTTTVAIKYVTDGAVVGVANASRINGAAKRMTDRLASVGFKTGTPTDYPPGQLDTTVIYFVPGDAKAQAVAKSVREALGGGSITLAEVTKPAPTESGELGPITVLVAMGNDVADKTLKELQTGTTAPKPPPTTAAPAATTAAPAATTAAPGATTAAPAATTAAPTTVKPAG